MDVNLMDVSEIHSHVKSPSTILCGTTVVPIFVNMPVPSVSVCV
jgi:hypothetical protein